MRALSKAEAKMHQGSARMLDLYQRYCRLGCRCFYDQTPRLPFVATEKPSTLGQSTLVLQHSTSPSNNATCRTGSYHLPASLGVSSYDCTGICQSDSLFAEAIKLAGPLGDIKHQTSKYFASIHIWLPVVSRVRFYDAVRRLPGDLSSRTAWILLGCTMRMIAYVPHDGTATGTGNMNESLYRQVKRMLLLTELECKPSLDLVQAWLLMASYEIGHGLESAAYLSIGSCARLAILLGLERKFDGGANSTLMEEKSRTWWGIVIVERHINLAFPHRPLLTSDPEANGYLPAYDDDKWDDGSGQSRASVPMTTSSDIPAGPFAREVQAATLLGRTLTHITKPTPDVEFNVAESRQLDRTLTSFLSVLPAEDVLKPCSAYCGAMGICTSALLLLHTYEVNHQHNFQNDWHNFPSSQDAIGFCCDFVIERAAKYTSELATVDIDSLSPFAPHAIYQASVLQYRFLAQSGSNKHTADIRLRLDMLEEMLASFSRRWGTAGQLYQRLRGVLPLEGTLTNRPALT
ncbi:Fungal specific transcription factor domain-containing protein isoform 3 [Cladophialophora immunda]|nr:Fungal specific transcription factor domain-containing protein isoform 3 [Cladophialophora immunda]